MSVLPAFQLATQNFAAASPTLALTTPAGETAGDCFFAILSANTNTSPSVVPTGWTLVQTFNSTTVLGIWVYQRPWRNTPIVSSTWTWAAPHDISGTMVRWTGLATGTIGLSPATGATASNAFVTGPQQTITAFLGAVMFECYAQLSPSTYSAPPSGWAIDAQEHGGATVSTAIASKRFDAYAVSGTGTIQVTTTGTAVGVAISFMVLPRYIDVAPIDTTTPFVAPPVITSSTSSSLTTTGNMVIDVTLPEGFASLNTVEISVDWPNVPFTDQVYDETNGYGSAYSGGSVSNVGTITKRYTFTRAPGSGSLPGWIGTSPTFHVEATDLWGNKTTASFTPTVTGPVFPYRRIFAYDE